MSWGKAAEILVRDENYCTEIELYCEHVDYGLEMKEYCKERLARFRH